MAEKRSTPHKVTGAGERIEEVEAQVTYKCQVRKRWQHDLFLSRIHPYIVLGHTTSTIDNRNQVCIRLWWLPRCLFSRGSRKDAISQGKR